LDDECIIIIIKACKAEIINISEYLNTNYKEDQVVKIVKNQENTQPNMNSIIKSAANFMERVMQNRMKYNTRSQDWERF
jgi:DNA-binding transcriptional regulator LsrR (DeoR family)